MAEDERREAISQAVKERIKKSEELQLIQMMTNAIGEQRYHDLSDLLSQLEQDQGWPKVLQYLSKSRNLSYNLPLGVGPQRTKLEELKYRETIFALLECQGFEPIPLTIEEIFSTLENEDSLQDASKSFFGKCKSLATEQIESGDSLFYNLNYIGSSIPTEIVDLIEEVQHKEITTCSLTKHTNTINILPFWYCEKGRQALAHLGIKGIEVDFKTFDVVLSVLQISIEELELAENEIKEETLTHPSNPLYDRLLSSIIYHDIENLIQFSSKHTYDTLKFILDDSIDCYEISPTSSNFRSIISSINAHVRIRTPESISPLEMFIRSKDIRIATTAITALGNFYNESATTTLVDLLCETKNNEIANTTSRAIKNISKKCMEAKYILKSRTDSQSCTNMGRVKRLYKDIWKESDNYYL